MNNIRNNNFPPVIMTIAGSDSGAGAGIQADLKTISANNAYGVCVITAITAQNTMGLNGIHPIPIGMIENQFKTITDDFNVQSIKSGMLYSNEVIEIVANCISETNINNYVLDPVMIATSGDKLIKEKTLNTMTSKLFPLAKLITPNVSEAEKLVGYKINSIDEVKNAATELLDFGSYAVLIKGWEDNTENNITDVFIEKNHNTQLFTKKKINTKNLHGTGCTLSAAIATYIAKESDLYSAILKSEKYIENVINNAKSMNIGKGNGPLWHY
jgi:hydroxymethylpyrimidine/phosphomethylpyrimidine kinase